MACPHERCGWIGSLIPFFIQGGEGAEIASMSQAWFRCSQWQRDREVRITNDRVTVLPAFEHGG